MTVETSPEEGVDPGPKRSWLSITWVRQIFSFNFSAPNPCDKPPCNCNGRKRGEVSSVGRGDCDEGGSEEEENTKEEGRGKKDLEGWKSWKVKE